MSQARYQEIQRSVIAFLEAHLIPLKDSHYQQVVSDFVLMIDDQFPGRSTEDLSTATRGFLAAWGKTTWPTMGQLIRGLTASMPKMQAPQIENKSKPDPERHAAALLRSDLGQEAIQRGVASWLWDWAMKNPDRDPPAGILDQLQRRDRELHEQLSYAAAGEPGPLTMNEMPAEPAKDWAIFALAQIKRREASMATWYGR